MEILKLNKWNIKKYILELRSGDRTIITDEGAISKISNLRIGDVIPYLEKIIYSRNSDDEAIRIVRSIFGRRYWRIEIKKSNASLIDKIEVNFNEKDRLSVFSFFVSSKPFLLINNYTFIEYKNHLESKLIDYSFNNKLDVKKKTLLTKSIDGEVGFWISISSANRNISIFNLVLQITEDIKNIHELTEKELVIINQEKIIQTYFEFPDEIRFACQQYLIYFVKFLEDIGIQAESSLKKDAGKILFSVIPLHNNEGLDKIREALAVYLNLPSSPIVFNESFAAMRLQQQIENLQHSQRMAVRELQFNEKLLTVQSQTISEKNITISHQQSVIEQQNKIIEKISSKSIMIDSAENKEELEEICDGLKIGKSKFLMEQLGVHLNPATFAKGIGKKILGKQDETSILDLNQEKKENN